MKKFLLFSVAAFLCTAAINYAPPKTNDAPSISITSVIPSNTSGDVLYLTAAPLTSKRSASALVSMQIEFKNNEANTVYFDKAIVTLTGNGNNISKTVEPDDDGIDTIKAGKSYTFQNGRDYHELGDVIQLSAPYPTQVRVQFYFIAFTDPVTVTKKLTSYTNLTPGGAYTFPAKDENLLMNEYWYGDAGHGGGGQVFAYDLVVMGWDETAKKWNEKKQGKTKDENASFRAYGKKIYSPCDGEILDFINTWQESPSTSDTGTKGGNFIKINNGNETVCIYHMQKGSLDDKVTQKGAKISKGQFIGLVGNSGNSSAPHLHMHVIYDPDKDGQGPYVPLHFSDMYAIDIKEVNGPDPTADWVKLTRIGLPYVEEDSKGSNGRALLWPDAKKPCWYPYNLPEIARHGIPENIYQEEFMKIWGCGYYPVWVDAYDVAGKTYFNTIFRYNKNNYDVDVKHNMSVNDYQVQYTKLMGQGYRLQQLDNYLDNGQLKMAAIFIKKPGTAQAQPAYHGKSPTEHQALFEKYRADGYVPVNVSVVSVGGKLYYSAFYEKRNVGGIVLKSSLAQQEFQDTFDDMSKKNYDLVYVNAYHHDGQTRFSAIWYQNSGYKVNRVTRRSSIEDYQEKYEDNVGDGLLTRCVTGYNEGGKHWFAAHWAK